MNNQHKRMTSMFHDIAIVTLLMGTFISQSRAQTPAEVIDAIERLREAPNYSWTTTTEAPGAPFTISPIEGKTNTTGFAVMVSRVGEKSLQAVNKGNRGVVRMGAEWKMAAEIPDGKDSTLIDARGLLNAMTPAEELAAILPSVIDLKLEADSSYVFALDSESARAAVTSLIESRAPRPMKPSQASGTLRIWLKDGLPQRYVLTIVGTVKRLFMEKRITKITTVTITDIGSTKVEIPADAQKILESLE